VFHKFYNLSAQPFQLTPDARFFYDSTEHSRAISHLVYGLAQQEGFIVITGEVGSGKTTLTEQLWSQLDHNTYIISRVVTTQVSGDDLLRLALANFGLGETQGTDKATLLRRFEQMVAEHLSFAAMEELRMMSNITVGGKASLQTILLGQPQFRPILASTNWEQLRQRVLASYHLGPLNAAETRLYILHRLRTVGWQDDPVWDDAAFAAVHRHTGGTPRRINTLCSRLLLLGALEETHTISGTMVDETAEELKHDLGDGGQPSPMTHPADEDHASLVRRIETLERNTLLQGQSLKRLLDLLEILLRDRHDGAR
jgi:general secretion pathway protein A